MVEDRKSTERRKIPLLGDIPYLGALFRWDNEIHTKKNVIIMITPYILKSSDDLQRLKDELANMETLKRSYSMKVLNAIKSHNKIEAIDLEEEW